MSLALFALSLCTFALGLAEFVAVSLVPAVAAGTHLNVSSVGMMIGIYAIGVSIGAPTLSALLAKSPRKTVLAVCMLVFAAGNIGTALTSSMAMLLLTRFIAGLMHGVVIALAASTAASAVSQEKSGNAIATVFAGLTVALMLGVPLGTLAGSHFAWQDVFFTLGGISIAAAIAVLFFMPKVTIKVENINEPSISVWSTLTDRQILHPVVITALTYAGSFTGFTYISVLLAQNTHLGASGITGMFAIYGVAAAIGNALGGRFVDAMGSRAAAITVIAGIGLALVNASLFSSSTLAMSAVMAVWGIASFGAVPIMQKTVFMMAQGNPVASPEVASGMNIAAFNVGIAAGSILGGIASLYSATVPMVVGLLPLLLAALFAIAIRPALAIKMDKQYSN
ncbi:MFS transporter [Rouxiella silvae]|uniref:MFS transporter n=1 Tax=Rouxiella silvae TaxID=1646373 RepID=A0AA40X1X3_9GAMM|nr:MFS transporter [Rouxiella silvae]MBF6637248.1 MFS transporter [Rouxiella silvae]